MLKIERLVDSWGDIYINVGECEKFKYEHPDTPKKDLCQHDFEDLNKDDII